jgi:hypothetical protein
MLDLAMRHWSRLASCNREMTFPRSLRYPRVFCTVTVEIFFIAPRFLSSFQASHRLCGLGMFGWKGARYGDTGLLTAGNHFGG